MEWLNPATAFVVGVLHHVKIYDHFSYQPSTAHIISIQIRCERMKNARVEELIGGQKPE